MNVERRTHEPPIFHLSSNSVIPDISDISPLNNVDCLLNPDALRIILNPESKTSLKDINVKQNEGNSYSIEIFIGPEGGLAEAEISYLQTLLFQNIWVL